MSAIERINNTSHDKLKFKDFAKLKSGRDKFSSLKSAQLLELTGKDCLKQIEFDDPALIDKVLRWMCRGLTIDKAIRKVKVDAEIAENAVKAKYNYDPNEIAEEWLERKGMVGY